jgi:PEP-CTERM motif-containing protein
MIGQSLGDVAFTEHVYDDLEYEFGGPLNPGTGETHILEFSFDLTNIAGFSTANTVGFHNTLGCGNDLMEKCFSAVPEPTTWILLGMGALGMGAVSRRKKSQ